jgi:hypothetical protein
MHYSQHKGYRGSPLSVHLTYSIFEEWAHFWDLNLALRFLGKVAGINPINGDAALKAAPPSRMPKHSFVSSFAPYCNSTESY